MDRISTATTGTTAWWGFCPECRLYFGNHLWACSHLPTIRVDLVGATLSPIAWPVNTVGAHP